MSVIPIFDLDDTLFDERTYVESGLRAVADFGFEQFGWEKGSSFEFMKSVLDSEGRGLIFDRWLTAHQRYNKSLLRMCVHRYRHHVPRIVLYEHAQNVLSALNGYPLYLVTDGHKVVQQRKVEALGIGPLFRRVMITHCFGVRHCKPSTYCFEKIRAAEGCRWSDLIYIGDNPAKDFVNLNRVGARTVRVLTGMHKDVEARPGFEAQHRIPNVGFLTDLMNGPEWSR